MEIRRKKGDFNDLEFTVDLSDYGKSSVDISEVYFSVKQNLKDSDDSIMLKTRSSGKISHTGTTVLSVKVEWGTNEYGNFEVNRVYKAGLFLKFAGDPYADENVPGNFDLVITDGFLNTH